MRLKVLLLTFGLFLFYAFTPLPSNYLFIAYGLTTMPFVRLLVPFFIGRFVSYYFWAMSAVAVSRKLELEETDAMAYFGVYFVLTQLCFWARSAGQNGMHCRSESGRRAGYLSCARAWGLRQCAPGEAG